MASGTEIHSIAVVGTGVVGVSWAAFFAAKGFQVHLYDENFQVCSSAVHKALNAVKQMGQAGLIPADAAETADGRLTAHSTLGNAVRDVQLVQESVAENYSAKRSIFGHLDELTPPSVLLASSSSGLLMTEIQKAVQHPGRCAIAHPFNPPHLIPLVELVPGSRTDRQVLQSLRDFFQSLGKMPVVLKKEVPGHIANRLAAALWREAIDLVLQGVTTVEDVDRAVCAGPGLRWALMGQHMIYHLGGGEGGIEHFIDHLGAALETWWGSLADWTHMPADARETLKNGLDDALKGRSAQEVAQWRDAKLVEMLKVIYTKSDV